MKIITTGQVFLMNYELSGFQNNKVNWYEFVLLGMQVQTKIQILVKFQIIEFRTDQVLLYILFTHFSCLTTTFCQFNM
jgi:hypothetical protein